MLKLKRYHKRFVITGLLMIVFGILGVLVYSAEQRYLGMILHALMVLVGVILLVSILKGWYQP